MLHSTHTSVRNGGTGRNAFSRCAGSSGCERQRPGLCTEQLEVWAPRGFHGPRPRAPPFLRPTSAQPSRGRHALPTCRLSRPARGSSAAPAPAARLPPGQRRPLVRTGAGAGRLASAEVANRLRAYGAAPHRDPDVAGGTLSRGRPAAAPRPHGAPPPHLRSGTRPGPGAPPPARPAPGRRRRLGAAGTHLRKYRCPVCVRAISQPGGSGSSSVTS